MILALLRFISFMIVCLMELFKPNPRQLASSHIRILVERLPCANLSQVSQVSHSLINLSCSSLTFFTSLICSSTVLSLSSRLETVPFASCKWGSKCPEVKIQSIEHLTLWLALCFKQAIGELWETVMVYRSMGEDSWVSITPWIICGVLGAPGWIIISPSFSSRYKLGDMVKDEVMYVMSQICETQTPRESFALLWLI